MRADQLTFDSEVLGSQGVVLVDFYATWCGPCKSLAPRLDQVARQYSDSLKIVKVDVDQNEDLARQYGVRSLPTLIFFRDGREQDRINGAPPADALRRLVEAQL